MLPGHASLQHSKVLLFLTSETYEMVSSGIVMDPRSYTKLYLNGQYVSPQSQKTYSLENPKDGNVVTDGIPVAGPADIDLAVQYAEEAFNGPWRKFTAAQRTECFNKLAKLVETHLVDILTLDSHTSGNPTSIIPTREKTYIKNTIAYYAGWTDKQTGDYLPADDGLSSPERRLAVCLSLNYLLTVNRICKAGHARAVGSVCSNQSVQRASRHHVPESRASSGHWKRYCKSTWSFICTSILLTPYHRSSNHPRRRLLGL